MRIGRRLSLLFNNMVETGSSVILRCNRTAAERAGAYRAIHNRRYDMENLIEAVSADCVRRCTGVRHVLCIQDTTEYDYGHIRHRLSLGDPDFGPGSQEFLDFSIFAHPYMAVDAESLTPLGFLGMEVWSRPREACIRRAAVRDSLPLSQKESCRWALAPSRASRLPGDVTATIVSDREGDIAAALSAAVRGGCHFLVRSHYDRMTDGGVRLSTLMSSVPPCLTFELEIPASHGRKRRTARMELRFSKVRLLPPRKARKEEGDDIPLDACCVQATEIPGSAPPDCTPVEWRLLTSHDISTAEQALACIGWYKARWLIEELFRVTKTKGFNVEEAALEDGEATKKLIVMTLCAALKTMALKNAYDRRDEEAEADLLFTPAETGLLHALAGMVHSWSPRAAGGNCPFRDGTMAWAAWVVARIGGWLPNNKNKDRPGRIAINKGLNVFAHYVKFINFVNDTT